MSSRARLFVLTVGALTTSALAQPIEVFGLTNNSNLYRLSNGTSTLVGAVSLPGGATPLSLDFRATDRSLYVLGSNGSIYTLSQADASATLVSANPGNATPQTPPTLGESLSQAGTSGQFEIDFNPAANALRVIEVNGGNRDNMRIGGGAGLTTYFNDGNYPGSVTPTSTAYANNDINPATPTFQFFINNNAGAADLHQIENFNTPAGASLPLVSNLGLSIGSDRVGLDIFTAFNGSNTGFVSIGSTVSSFTMNVAGITGGVSGTTIGPVSTFGTFALGGGESLVGITAVPEPTTLALLAGGLALVARRRSRA